MGKVTSFSSFLIDLELFDKTGFEAQYGQALRRTDRQNPVHSPPSREEEGMMHTAFAGRPTERRAKPRAILETSATVHMVNQEFTCVTRDLSAEGIALSGKVGAAPTGTFLRILFKLPNVAVPVDVDGILVRTAPAESHTTWGLKFLEPAPTVIEQIESYLDSQGIHDLPPYTPALGDSGPAATPDPAPPPLAASAEQPSLEAKPANGLDSSLLGHRQPAAPQPAPTVAAPVPEIESIPVTSLNTPRSPSSEQGNELLGFYEQAMSHAAADRAEPSEEGAAADPSPQSAGESFPQPSSGGRPGAGLNAALESLYEEAEAHIGGESPYSDKAGAGDSWVVAGDPDAEQRARENEEPLDRHQMDLQAFYEQAMSRQVSGSAAPPESNKTGKESPTAKKQPQEKKQ
jgi:hypothetical protein